MVSHNPQSMIRVATSERHRSYRAGNSLNPGADVLVKHIYRRMVTITKDRQKSYNLRKRLRYYLSQNGKHWLCSYLKACGQGIIWAITGENRPEWVRMTTNFRSGRQIPDLFSEFGSFDDQTLLRIAKVARSIKFERLTKAQVRKRLGSVLNEPTSVSLTPIRTFVQMGLRDAFPFRLDWSAKAGPTVTRQWRRCVSVSGKTELQYEPPIRESLVVASSSSIFQDLDLKYRSQPFYPLDSGEIQNELLSRRWADESYSDVAGEIHATQEGGGKLRLFAAPFAYVQTMLYPLHYHLRRYLDRHPANCILNQLGGAEWTQGKLRDKHVVYSIDQTAATCRFPLDPQIYVLKELGIPDEQINLFCWAARATWNVGEELRPQFPDQISWRVGQPLGIAPSMSCYALTMILVLHGLCIWHDFDPYDSFRVLGDDVVCVNDKLASSFISLMQTSGVEINSDKSYRSSVYAEFAGASITKDFIFRPGQWKPLSLLNLVDYSNEFELSNSELAAFSSNAITACNLVRFDQGTYVPRSPEEFTYLLKLNSTLALSKVDIYPDLNYVYASKTFTVGLRDYLRNHGLPFSVYDPGYSRLRDTICDILETVSPRDVRLMRQHLINFFATHEHLGPTGSPLVMSALLLWCTNTFLMLTRYDINRTRDALVRVEEAIYAMYWLPPRTKSRHGILKSALSIVLTTRFEDIASA